MKDIGVNARKQNRLNQIERINRKSQQVFEKYYPNPDIAPERQQFYDKWNKYIDEIANTFGRIGDYRRAFNIGVSNVLKYKKHNGWKVTPPSYIVTHKSPKPLRTLTWMQQAWEGFELYDYWYNEELLKSSVQSKQQAFRNLVLSFIYHSGQSNPDVVYAFQKMLNASTIQLNHWGRYPYLSVNVESNRFNTNVVVRGIKVTQFQCYLHTITLGLLRVWNRLKHQPWDIPNDKEQLITVLTKARNSLTFTQLCRTSVYATENQSHVSLSQALVEYQVSRTKSYGLPSSNLTRLHHPTVFPVTNITYNTNKPSTCIKHPKINKNREQHLDIYQELKNCLYPKNMGQVLTSNTLKQKLESLLMSISGNDQLISICPLISWYRFKLKTCSVSTIRAYHSNLSRKWCYICAQFSLKELSSTELEDVYKQAIDSHTSNKSKKYFAGRLKDLHAFCVEHYSFPKVSSNYLHTDPTQTHTRSGFIDEALFIGLLNAIEATAGLNDADKLCVKSICIISYRCGLRLNELMKLRVKDIEPSNIGWISIRDTHLGTNKTAASLRKVPLFPMLLEHEEEIINRYMHIKLEKNLGKKCPFFSIESDPKLPIKAFQISMFVGDMLKSLSQLDYFVFHHLRHSCISRLQLILEINVPSSLPNQMSAYNEKQTKKIYTILFGRSKMNGYDIISAFAGHESPRMTFEHYFHFSDWIIAQKLNIADYSIPKASMSFLGLLPKRTPKNHRTLVNALPYLVRKLHVEPCVSNIHNGIAPILNPSNDKELISIPICHSALTLHQQGFLNQDICSRLKISEATLDKWINNARSIKALFVNSKNAHYSRHFSALRQNKLVPAELKMPIEIKMQNQYIKELKKHYNVHRIAINDAISYALNHSSISRSGIHFNSPNELTTFIETTHLFIPKSHWRAATQYLNKSVKKADWVIALEGISTFNERTSLGRSKKTQGAVRLELIHPKMRDNKEYKIKQSSPLLMHLFHMFGIMMMT